MTPTFGTVWADMLLAQEADSPAPQFLHCPRHRAKMQIPLGAKKILRLVSHMHCSHSLSH